MWARAGREGKGRGDATRSWPCGGGKWASVAHAGREEERGRAGLAKALGWFPSLFFSFLFSTLTPIQTNLIEFKIQFEFKPINSTQLKKCCSMSAQHVDLMINFIFLCYKLL
jgi:hypothetical protein